MESTVNRLFAVLNIFCLSRYYQLIKSPKLENRVTYYGRLLFFAILYIVLVVFRELYPLNRLNKGSVAKIVEVTNYYGRIPIAFVTYLIINSKFEEIRCFYDGIIKVNKKISTLGFEVNITSYAKRLRIICGVMVIKILLQQIPHLVHDRGMPFLINHLVITYSSSVLYLTNILWISSILLLFNGFKTMNEALKILKYRQCWVIEDYKQQNALRNIPSELLKRSAFIYGNLCTLSKEINTVFSWVILMEVPMLFVGIIFDTFTVCHMIQRILEFDGKYVIYDIIGMMSFLEIVWPCILLKEESEKFMNGLNKLDLDLKDSQLEMLSNSLALQMYHQKVNLTANNVFPLDGTLVYSIFGAITTYLVILLQFDN